MIGVPVGFEEGVSVTKPYYRSTYALVFPKGKGMDNVGTVEVYGADRQRRAIPVSAPASRA